MVLPGAIYSRKPVENPDNDVTVYRLIVLLVSLEYPVSWLIMTWRRKLPGNHQQLYWFCEIGGSFTMKEFNYMDKLASGYIAKWKYILMVFIQGISGVKPDGVDRPYVAWQILHYFERADVYHTTLPCKTCHQHIKAGTKWTPINRRQFHIHFTEWKNG